MSICCVHVLVVVDSFLLLLLLVLMLVPISVCVFVPARSVPCVSVQ